ncbi:MBL fold metallo-hydrolase [Lachnospiraceae bacterium 54-53]
MKITYIHHSSFLVELETVTLLFDYTEGPLPEFHNDKLLLVFASHRHGDHYSEKILEFKKIHENTRYILSDDIRSKRIPEEILKDVISMKPGEQYDLRIPAGKKDMSPEEEAGRVQIQTFLSTDEGVAFLIEAEGKVIYHAGDLNNWRWEGEPESWNDSMAKKYSEQVDKMAGMHMDAAFLPLDPRQEEAFYLGFHEFMEKTKVDHAFPMHCWGDFSVIKRLKEMELSEPYRDRIADIHEDGEYYEIR